MSVEGHEQRSVANLIAAITTIGVAIGLVFGTAFCDTAPGLFWLCHATITFALSIYAFKINDSYVLHH